MLQPTRFSLRWSPDSHNRPERNLPRLRSPEHVACLPFTALGAALAKPPPSGEAVAIAPLARMKTPPENQPDAQAARAQGPAHRPLASPHHVPPIPALPPPNTPRNITEFLALRDQEQFGDFRPTCSGLFAHPHARAAFPARRSRKAHVYTEELLMTASSLRDRPATPAPAPGTLRTHFPPPSLRASVVSNLPISLRGPFSVDLGSFQGLFRVFSGSFQGRFGVG